MNTELLPCPFCGGKAEYHFSHTDINFVGVRCSECHAQMFYGISADYTAKDECIKAWNRRANEKNENDLNLRKHRCKDCSHYRYSESKDKHYCVQRHDKTGLKLAFEIKDIEQGCAGTWRNR